MSQTDQRVTLEKVVIRRGSRVLVSELTWSHQPGRIAWLVGENGTGKSSLMRVLAGLSRPSSGIVSWLNATSQPQPAYYNPAMAMPADVRVSDWVVLVEALRPMAAESERSRHLLSQTVAVGTRFNNLSTGEAKRLLLWALLQPPARALLLDEPYEHLSRDAKLILTNVLAAIAHTQVVIIATNQDVTGMNDGVVLTIDDNRVRVAGVPA